MRFAKLLDPKEISNYFKGPVWLYSKLKPDGSFNGRTKSFFINLSKPVKSFGLKVESGTPSDSLDIKTDEPIKELVKFLGGEIFMSSISSSPSSASSAIKYASRIKDPSKILRRIGAAISSVHPANNSYLRYSSLNTLNDVKSRLHEKKWKFHEKDGVIFMEIGDFSVEITDEGWEWHFEMGLIDNPSVKESGLTDDPIKVWNSFRKSDKVREGLRDLETVRTEELLEPDTEIPDPDLIKPKFPRSPRLPEFL